MQEEPTVPPTDRQQEGVRPPDDPRYPPQSMTRPAVKRSFTITYVGGIALLFAIIGAGMIYWANRDKDRVDSSMPQAVGTVGSAAGGHPGASPGGGDPAGRPGSTRDELEVRGAGGSTQAQLTTGAAVTAVAALVDGPPDSVDGKTVDLRNVEVVSSDGATFWIRDGSAKVAVVSPTASPQVPSGSRVDVKGEAEADGNGGVRIRADSIDVR